MKVDLECHWKNGIRKDVADYARKFPELLTKSGRLPEELMRSAHEVMARYGSDKDTEVVGPSGGKSNYAKVRCPYCAALVEVGESDSAESVTCISCSSPFRWDPITTRGTDPVAIPPAIGKYDILGVLGRGAFGLVYKAKDWELGRLVALKMPRAGDFGSDEEQQRFLREARSAASLKHPGIVDVYGVSHEEGTTCIISEFIDGLALSELLTGPKLGYDRVAEIVSEVADALHHAHQHGIIHRDIKPGNILIDKLGKPHLADFGLARDDDEDITVTQSGQILGTPAYMSPEQAEGDQRAVGPASDIYCLGAMLYEMLTGELPFRGSSRMLIHQILNEEPASPRRLNDRIPQDLDTICLKALSKEPKKRYETAAKMAEDLRRWLHNEPILARPISTTERFMRWSKRNPTVATLGGLVILLLVAIAAGATLAAIKINKSRLETEEALITAKLDRDQKESALRKQRADALDASQSFAEESVRAAEHNRFDEAGIRAKAAERLYPSGPWGPYAFGLVAFHRKDFAAAEQFMKEALEKDPQHLPSKAALSRILVEAGRTEEAMKIFQSEEVTDWQTVRATGDVLFDAKKYAEAQKAFGKALDLFGRRLREVETNADSSTLLQSAEVCLKAGLFTDARAHFEEAIQKLKGLDSIDQAALNRAEKGFKEAASQVKYLTEELATARDDCWAWTQCEGFYDSVKNLPESVQRQRILAKLEDLHGKKVSIGLGSQDGALRTLNNFPGVRFLHPFYGFQLNSVDASWSLVSDLTPLEGMPIDSLYLTNTLVDDLRPIKGMPLKKLSLARSRVTDLEPLRGMPLEWLQVGQTGITDLAPLQGMKLTYLVCQQSGVSDLTPLAGMPITELRIDGTKVSDLTLLRGMPLTLLWCGYTLVKDLSPISGMKLTDLSCSGVPIEDLSILEGMPLKHLALTETKVRDLTPLKGMPLEHLNLEGAKVTDLSPLKDMPLTFLNIRGDPVTDFSPIRNLPIKHLMYSSDNYPVDATTLRQLPLKDLHVDKPATLENFRGLKLQTLHTHKGAFKDLSPLAGMPLERLIIPGAPVKDLSPLKGMPLKDLDLTHTLAIDLTPLEGMKLKEFRSPPKGQLTPASLKLIEQWQAEGCNVVW